MTGAKADKQGKRQAEKDPQHGPSGQLVAANTTKRYLVLILPFVLFLLTCSLAQPFCSFRLDIVV